MITTNIEINKAKKIQDPVMADCGTEYFTTFEYRMEGDIDLYGDDEWRTGKVIWNTTDAWKAEGERVESEIKENPDARIDYGILDDESMACDWDEYEIQDEYGDLVAENARTLVSEMVESI